QAILTRADLSGANLCGANLRWSHLYGANLDRADLRGADLCDANLYGAHLLDTDLSGADLRGASLIASSLVSTNVENANFAECQIYGISAWDLKGLPKDQTNLVLTRPSDQLITVDNLQVAQFLYLMRYNPEIRTAIDTITSKVVVILGRFTEERKATLDALRQELRKEGLVPVLFDFEKPMNRDLTETVSTIAHLARFVIADITDAKSIPQELQKIVPNLPSLPIQPIILESQYEYAMFKDFGGYFSVLPPYRYKSTGQLIASLEKSVIAPVVKKAQAIAERRKEFEAQLQ